MSLLTGVFVGIAFTVAVEVVVFYTLRQYIVERLLERYTQQLFSNVVGQASKSESDRMVMA